MLLLDHLKNKKERNKIPTDESADIFLNEKNVY